jgi:hypothetical protein
VKRDLAATWTPSRVTYNMFHQQSQERLLSTCADNGIRVTWARASGTGAGRLAGDGDPQELWLDHPLSRGVDPDAVNVALAAFAADDPFVPASARSDHAELAAPPHEVTAPRQAAYPFQALCSAPTMATRSRAPSLW